MSYPEALLKVQMASPARGSEAEAIARYFGKIVVTRAVLENKFGVGIINWAAHPMRSGDVYQDEVYVLSDHTPVHVLSIPRRRGARDGEDILLTIRLF